MPVSLFGGITITASDGETKTLSTRKTVLVLAVLALLDDKGTTRDALAEWIWPDRSEGQAKSSLRQALTSIRKAMPSILEGFGLETELSTVKLTGPRGLIDVRQFETLTKTRSLEDQLRAGALYRGDLLDGVKLPAPLESMAGPRRQRLRQQALALVERTSKHPELTKAGRRNCEALANRLLSSDPAAEEAHRAIIRIRVSDGQPNAALRQLECCVEAVQRELGVEPEARTMALLDPESGRSAAAEGPAPFAGETGASGTQPVDSRSRPAAVVMPFDDLGGQDGDFLADGVVEEITAALSRIRDFFVIARQSAYTYKGRFVDVREVARDLGVQYAVEGTVRRGGDKVRINVQLIETGSGAQIWSDRYESVSSDLFELQDRIASHVAGAISPRIRASEIELAQRTPPESLQAYDLVLRAFPHFWAHRKEENRKALNLFDEALERDPDYGVALAFKAWCHAQQACYLWTDNPAEERAKAVATAGLAAQCVDDHATALVAIGATYSITTTDQELAASFINRSLALDPNNAWGWMRAGYQKMYSREDDAIECFERALALSPLDPFTFNMYFGMSGVYAGRGEYKTAAELVEKGLRAGPGVTWAYRLLATIHAQAGDEEKAAEAARKFMEYYPGITIETMQQGIPPALELTNPNYWEGMRKAGIPEA